MVAACQANGVRLMIAYRKYFEPGSVALKELVTRGKLGRLRHIFSSYTEIGRASCRERVFGYV